VAAAPPSPAPAPARRTWHRFAAGATRELLGWLPRGTRQAILRRGVDTSRVPAGLRLRIARSAADFEACFALLHAAYTHAGFMRPHPSGLRVTPYHALPTTTTLLAELEGEVIGTLSIVREGVFGFPMQSAFDLSAVRAKEGRIAEISALAVHPRHRDAGGGVLFALMKFMFEYCTRFFDTRHLVIAVNPNRFELYEALLFFERLHASVVASYDFANGAPAVGATLDLHAAPARFHAAYGGRPARRDLHRFFVQTPLPGIQVPERPWFTSNDPVMTPALLDHFFNRRTQVFAELDARRRRLLHAVYPGPEWQAVLPPLPPGGGATALRRHARHSMQCPARLFVERPEGTAAVEATVIEVSQRGFQARAAAVLRPGLRCRVVVRLAPGIESQLVAVVVRRVAAEAGLYHGFHIAEPDSAWRRCVAALEAADRASTAAGPYSAGHASPAAAADAPVHPGPAPALEAA
jgi:GNAT superfamily N-acetyltransferase